MAGISIKYWTKDFQNSTYKMFSFSNFITKFLSQFWSILDSRMILTTDHYFLEPIIGIKDVTVLDSSIFRRFCWLRWAAKNFLKSRFFSKLMAPKQTKNLVQGWRSKKLCFQQNDGIGVLYKIHHIQYIIEKFSTEKKRVTFCAKIIEANCEEVCTAAAAL